MNRKRSLLASLLLMALMVFLLSACSDNNTKSKLSELKDDELLQYMTDAGVVIPEDIGVDTIREMLTELEDDPGHPAPVVGYTPLSDLYEDIRDVLSEYEANRK